MLDVAVEPRAEEAWYVAVAFEFDTADGSACDSWRVNKVAFGCFPVLKRSEEEARIELVLFCQKPCPTAALTRSL